MADERAPETIAAAWHRRIPFLPELSAPLVGFAAPSPYGFQIIVS